MPIAVAAVVWVALVAPLPVVTLAQVVPPSVLTCHCRVGAGVPVAATVKLAVAGSVTATSDGWVVKLGATGAGLTVSVATLLVAEPTLLVTFTRNWAPLSVDLTVAGVV
jgi:hypothetical protein